MTLKRTDLTQTDGTLSTLSTTMISKPGSKYFSSSSNSNILSSLGTAPLTDDNGLDMIEFDEQ